MASQLKSGGDTGAGMVLRLSKRFAYATATVFAAAGLVMLVGAADNVPPLRQRDPLFGVTTRTVLVLAGLSHLGISAWLFSTRDLMNHGLVFVWAGSNYLIYSLGMAVLQVTMPFPAVVVLAWEIGISSKTLFIGWMVFTAYLLTSGLVLAMLDRRRLKRLDLEKFLARWKIVREQSESASAKSPAAEAPAANRAKSGHLLKEPFVTDFKFACEHCGQHIQCSEHYAGQQINCPACRKLIQVPAISKQRT